MAPDLFLVSALSAVFFALGIVMSQTGLRYLPPLSGAAISVPTSALLFLLLSPLTVSWSDATLRSIAIFAVAGIFYPAAVSILNFVSNRRIGPNLTAAMGNLTPLFAIGFAIAILGEIPRPAQLAGIGIILAGLILLSTDRLRQFPEASLLVLALPLIGAAIRGAVQPIVKSGFVTWPDPFAAATISYLVSATLILSARWGFGTRPPRTDPTGIKWFVAIGLVNGLALVTLYISLSMGPVATVAPIVASYPLITYAMTRLVLKQRTVSRQGVFGIALSVAGVILVLTL